MNNVYTANIFRFIFLLLLQGLVLQGIDFKYINIFVYPIFLFLLPLELPHGLLILFSFMMGISVDLFYNSFGLHAAAMVGLAFIRPLLCALVEPRGGYEVAQTLTKHSLGLRWFFKYSALLCFVHLFFVTVLEDLGFSWLWLGRLLLGFVLSMILIILYQFIFNPKR